MPINLDGVTEKGSITVGKLADMVLLNEDIFEIPPERIRNVRALKTFVGGKLIFDGTKSLP
jgi:predicted amidohydrolase YtcJ